MSEPRATAQRVHRLQAGLYHWSVADERIGFRSDAWAVDTPAGLVAIDPLPLAEPAAGRLGRPARVVLTGAFHQRAAWSLRRRAGAPVWAPAGAAPLDEAPDRRFTDGEELAPGLVALDRPGPNAPHFVLVWRPRVSRCVLFCGDLLVRPGDDGPFGFAPAGHQRRPGRSRDSVRRLVALDARVLCPAHGGPLGQGVRAELERVLAQEPGG